MTSNIQERFQFKDAPIRVIVKEGELWFVAADVCTALGLSNATDSLKRLDADENTLDSIEGIHDGAGNPMVRFVNESGLYNLVLGSRKPEAKEFKRWVTHEVLPAIRRTGAYALMEQQEHGLPQLATWNGLPDLLDAADPVARKLGLNDEDTQHMKLRLTEFVSGVIFADTLPSGVRRAITDAPTSNARRRIHQLVVESGARGIQKVDLTRQTQTLNRATRDAIVRQLVQEGLIAECRPGNGHRCEALYPAGLAPVPA
jgi:prophage antirepressor-like protein